MMHLAVALLSTALLALAEDQSYYNNKAAPGGQQVYNEKTRFQLSRNFPYDYNGYPYNKAHQAVFQGIPAYAGGYGQPQQAAYQPQPQAAYQPPQPAYQPNSYQPQQAAPKAYKPVARDPYDLKTNGMQYHGLFNDKCVSDGLYFKNLNSFVICSNKNPSVQDCAPGSKNPDQANFKFGELYNKSDFCSINLVDLGFSANGGKGY